MSVKTILLRSISLLITLLFLSLGIANADTNDPIGEPGCNPDLPHDQRGGCPDGFQGKPHHGGPDDGMGRPTHRNGRNFEIRRNQGDPHGRNFDMRRNKGDRRGRDDGRGEPGCNPDLPHDKRGGCPDGFQGKPHHGGPDDEDMNPPGQEGDPYAEQCAQWEAKGSPAWDTHSVQHCGGGDQGSLNPSGKEGDPYAKQCEEWKAKGSPAWDTHSVEHCSGK